MSQNLVSCVRAETPSSEIYARDMQVSSEDLSPGPATHGIGSLADDAE
jgi:hypothetical protein